MPSVDALMSTMPSDLSLGEGERRAVLEIAALAVASDHVLDASEVAVLRALARRLRGEDPAGEAKDVEVEELLARPPLERDRAEERLRVLAKALPTPAARALAYRATLVLARADGVDADQEFELDLTLIDALELAQEDADRIAREVEAAQRATASTTSRK